MTSLIRAGTRSPEKQQQHSQDMKRHGKAVIGSDAYTCRGPERVLIQRIRVLDAARDHRTSTAPKTVPTASQERRYGGPAEGSHAKISAPAQHAGKRSKMWLLAFETTAELPPQQYAEIASDKPWYKDIVLSSVTHILVSCSNTRLARDRGFEDLES